MSAPAIDFDAPAASREPRHRALRAVTWTSATGLFTGAMWPFWLTVSLALYGRDASTYELVTGDDPSILLLLPGGFCGLWAGALVGLLSGRDRSKAVLVMGVVGTVCGAAGAGLTVPVMRAGKSFMDPLLSSALLWALIGAFAGLTGSLSLPADISRERNRTSPVLAALGWGLTGAACAGGSWGGSWYAVGAWLDVAFVLPGSESGAAVSALMLAGVGVIYGGIVGGIVGLFRRDRAGALYLMSAGALTAASGYGLSALAVALASGNLPPLLSSSLAMASVGFVVALCAYFTAPRPTRPTPDEPAYEDEEPAAPGAKVEWLLREPKRPWRIPRPLVRVLPVLVVAIGAGVGAAVASSLALFAVALLGSAVGWVLYRQEQRLDALERRSRDARDS